MGQGSERQPRDLSSQALAGNPAAGESSKQLTRLSKGALSLLWNFYNLGVDDLVARAGVQDLEIGSSEEDEEEEKRAGGDQELRKWRSSQQLEAIK